MMLDFRKRKALGGAVVPPCAKKAPRLPTVRDRLLHVEANSVLHASRAIVSDDIGRRISNTRGFECGRITPHACVILESQDAHDSANAT